MKLILSILGLCVCGAFARKLATVLPKQSSLYQKYIHGLPEVRTSNAALKALVNMDGVQQKLDNFDTSNLNTWTNIYAENGEFFQPGGPVFILLIGRGETSSFVGYLFSGLMYDAAKKNNAHMIILEHRYYGYSIPKDEANWIEPLKYLTVEQTMADMYNFIKVKKQSSDYSSSKFVLFGGAYPGYLAARMRQTYPDVVSAAVSSSPAILSVVDFSKYFDGLTTSINNASCVTSITDTLKEVQTMFTNTKDWTKLSTDLKLCSTVSSDTDIAAFFQQVLIIISREVEYGTPETVSNMCKAFNLPWQMDSYSRLINFLTKYLASKGNTCVAVYQQLLTDLQNKDDSYYRPWVYQQCSQIGDLFSTENSKTFPNVVPMRFWSKLCSDVYNITNVQTSLKTETDRLNSRYGGLTPDDSYNNIVTSYGDLDPWKQLGLQSSPSATAPLVIIKGVGHCADLQPTTESDSVDLIAARKSIADYITSFIS